MLFPKEALSLFKQVYDLAKTEESTKAQMQAIAQAGHDASKHSVRRKNKPDTSAALTEHTASAQIDGRMTRDTKYHLQTRPGSNGNSMAVSGVGINIVLMILAQLPVLNANTVGKQVISERVHEETTKTSERDCTRSRIQRPGNIPANDQVNGEKTRIMMKEAMTTLNQLQWALVLLRLTMQCIV